MIVLCYVVVISFEAVLRSEGVWEAAFSTFDKNGDGKVSISELATGKLLGKLPIEET